MTGMAAHDERAGADAAGWLARLQGEVSEADGLEFDAWLAQPGNAAAYRRALAAWHAFDAAAADVLAELDAPSRGARQRGPTARRGIDRRWWMAGGGMAVAAGIAAAVLPALVAQPAIGAYATGRGQHRHVVLADGTALDLNAETRVTVRLSRHSRQVELAEGEAIFDVVHDERRPFTVLAAGREIRDVGTQFDVKARGGALTVTVAKGKVEVRPEAASPAAKAYLLSPGERLAVGASGAVRLASVDPSETFSWRVGRLVYREQPLSEVVADLNRQFTTQIEIGDPELAQIPITGVVVLDDPAAVMSRLSLMLPIRSVPSDKGLTLLRK